MSSGSFTAAPRMLRASLYSGRPAQQVAAPAGTPTLAYILALLAVIVEFCVSGNTLTVLGIHYADGGGFPLVKFHPASYLAFMAAAASLAAGSRYDRGFGYLLTRAPALLLFGAIMVFCAVFAMANVGMTGSAIYIDTYLSAGALAVALIDASPRQRAILVRVLLVLLVGNVLMSLAEYAHQDHFIQMDIKTGDGEEITTDAESQEFRPTALYGHPLTGAMATSFAIFLLLAAHLGFATTAICFLLFAVGLLGFGGRAALGVTIAVLVLQVAVTMARDFVRGRVNGRLVAVVVLSLVVLVPLGGFLLTATPIGERLVARGYYDDSAEVRADQWQVLDKLTESQAMFGTPAADLQLIFTQVGLTGVENPFILVFLNLGIVGSPIFAFGLITYFLYLKRAYPDSAWLLLAAILILSGSNSIGAKSPDLVMLTACAVAMKDQAGRRTVRVLKTWPRVVLSNLRPRGLSLSALNPDTMLSAARSGRGLSSQVVRHQGRLEG